jgi:2-polyprenyl-6-methoxyphenol hydroxylase-like FAD-dependent oxidoreductase
MLQRRGAPTAPWLNFRCIRNERWYHGNVVLLGDAAHTTHFSIGSGTKLAIQDSIALARKLREHGDIPAALRAYDEERRTALASMQRLARLSTQWFENVPGLVDRDAVEFAYSLLSRRGTGPLWRYLLHLANQQSALREVLGSLHSARRWVRARRRDSQLPAAP